MLSTCEAEMSAHLPFTEYLPVGSGVEHPRWGGETRNPETLRKLSTDTQLQSGRASSEPLLAARPSAASPLMWRLVAGSW